MKNFPMVSLYIIWIFKSIVLIGYTDKVALYSNDRWVKQGTEDLASLSAGLIVTITQVFSFSQYYLMASKTLAVLVFLKAENVNHIMECRAGSIFCFVSALKAVI